MKSRILCLNILKLIFFLVLIDKALTDKNLRMNWEKDCCTGLTSLYELTCDKPEKIEISSTYGNMTSILIENLDLHLNYKKEETRSTIFLTSWHTRITKNQLTMSD